MEEVVKIYKHALGIYKNSRVEVKNFIVYFHMQEYMYRHYKAFSSYDEAYVFLQRILNSANPHNGDVTINEKHWLYVENEVDVEYL